MVQQQVPLATSHFSAKLKRALITQPEWVNGRLHREQPLQHALRSNNAPLPPNPVRETRGGVPGRSQLPSGAVFACNFTEEPIGLVTSLTWPPSSVCRGLGQQAW